MRIRWYIFVYGMNNDYKSERKKRRKNIKIALMTDYERTGAEFGTLHYLRTRSISCLDSVEIL